MKLHKILTTLVASVGLATFSSTIINTNPIMVKASSKDKVISSLGENITGTWIHHNKYVKSLIKIDKKGKFYGSWNGDNGKGVETGYLENGVKVNNGFIRYDFYGFIKGAADANDYIYVKTFTSQYHGKQRFNLTVSFSQDSHTKAPSGVTYHK